MSRLVQVAAVCAVLSGGGRIIAGLVPLAPASAAADILYCAIDVGFVLALAGLLAVTEVRLGWLGTVVFVPAISAAAIIAGPDGDLAGFDSYTLGAGVMLIALALAGGLMLCRDRRFWAAAILWIAAPGFAIIGQLLLAGLCFGAAFLAAGVSLQRYGSH